MKAIQCPGLPDITNASMTSWNVSVLDENESDEVLNITGKGICVSIITVFGWKIHCA